MKKRSRWLQLFMIGLMAFSLVLAGCEGDEGDTGPAGPPGPPGAGGDPNQVGSIISQWQSSGHADATSLAFTDWNAEGEVPTTCARCHTADGFVSYALDGTVEEAVETGQLIGCNACHSSTLYADFSDFDTLPAALEPVTFPSRLTATLQDPSNMCMACHQGRASKVQVDEAIAANPTGTFPFINIHYFAAAATLFGTEVKGGYEYDGKTYAGRFAHVPSRDTCVECHMGSNINHTFRPQAADCARCHSEVNAANAGNADVFRSIRRGSNLDYDGDGNTTEGLFGEINDKLTSDLLARIQQYSSTQLNTVIAYNPARHPYWFVDTNQNGQVDADETTRFIGFDAKLLRAAYNYQVVQKEPCGYIHNAHYLIQLLYDSIQDLGGDVSGYIRPTEAQAQGIIAEWESSGHADVEAEAFNDWNDTGSIPATCAKCHSREGFRDFSQDGDVDNAVTFTPILDPAAHVGPERTLTCGTCHVNQGEIAATTDPTTLWDARQQFTALEPVTFPSGLAETLNGPSNMCMACHQGRSSKVQVDQAVANAQGSFAFINIHYFPAAATFFGTDVKGGYEYDGQTYAGQNTFPAHLQLAPDFTTCVGCHMWGKALNHTFEPNVNDCTRTAGCHSGGDFEDFSGSPGQNFDQIQTLSEDLLAAIEAYASGTIGTGIIYDETQRPYFFQDANNDGVIDTGPNAQGVVGPLAYPLDAKLLRAGYNYHVTKKEPCGYIHNGTYIKQLLYDSTVDLGGTPTITPPNRGGAQPPPAGAPTANAGADQTDVALNTLVTLNASASTDPQNDPLTFSWELQGPQGSTATLTGANTANPTFTPVVAGTYTATVTVSDGTNTATDTVTITTAGAQGPDLAAGQAIYTNQCAGCHVLGTFDASGFAPNLADASATIAARFPVGVATSHNGVTVTLTAADLANLGGFVDSQ